MIQFIALGCLSQVEFTNEELKILAENNKERLYLKKICDLQKQEIDSLRKKTELLISKTEFFKKNEAALNSIIQKLDKVDQKRQEQLNGLKEENQAKTKTIRKQERKLNAWRLATPILTIGAFVTGIFIL